MTPIAEARTKGLTFHHAVREQLRADLDAGRWNPGDMLPTEAELARHFGLSIGTIRQAILALVREGLLTRRSGSGTFVARLDAARGFGRFSRFSQALPDSPVPQVEHIDTRIMGDGDPAIAMKLGVASDAPLYRVRRKLSADGAPICLYISHLAQARFADLERVQFGNRRLYATLEAIYGIHVLKVEEILHAGAPSAEEAEMMCLPVTAPVMIVERTAFGVQGSVVEWRRTVGRSDQFQYRIELP